MAYVSGMDASIRFTQNGGASKRDYVNIITIEYTFSKNKLPIFGYKSFEWDALLEGEELIQGTFGLNFTGAMQLNEYLDNSETRYDYKKLPLNKSTQVGTELYRDNDIGKHIKYNKLNNITKQVFDIEINYKNIKPMKNITEKAVYIPVHFEKSIFLKNVMINSVQQAISADATPIGEFYTFIGRSVIEEDIPPYYISNNKVIKFYGEDIDYDTEYLSGVV